MGGLDLGAILSTSSIRASPVFAPCVRAAMYVPRGALSHFPPLCSAGGIGRLHMVEENMTAEGWKRVVAHIERRQSVHMS